MIGLCAMSESNKLAKRGGTCLGAGSAAGEGGQENEWESRTSFSERKAKSGEGV